MSARLTKTLAPRSSPRGATAGRASRAKLVRGIPCLTSQRWHPPHHRWVSRASRFCWRTRGKRIERGKTRFPVSLGGTRWAQRAGREQLENAGRGARFCVPSDGKKHANTMSKSLNGLGLCFPRGAANQKRQNAARHGSQESAQEGRKRRGFAEAAALGEVIELPKSRALWALHQNSCGSGLRPRFRMPAPQPVVM
jgi:hypothetical protein